MPQSTSITPPLFRSRLVPRVALIYAATGALWILFSDALLGVLIRDPATLTWAQMIKGWAFVATTSIVLWGALTLALKERDRLVRSLLQKERGLEGMLYAGAHDLRTPLINIRGFAAEMREELDLWNTQGAHWDSPHLTEALDCAARVDRGVRTMADLLDGMLRLHRMARGQARPRTVDLERMALEEADPICTLHPWDPQVTLTSPLPPCFADPDDLREILRQLVRNGLLHNPTPSALLHISGQRNGTLCRYVFDDNGPGIPPDQCERVFEPFHRLTPGESPEGVGIGLALARQGAERNGGTLFLDKSQELGCRFVLELPASEPEDMAKLTPRADLQDPLARVGIPA